MELALDSNDAEATFHISKLIQLSCNHLNQNVPDFIKNRTFDELLEFFDSIENQDRSVRLSFMGRLVQSAIKHGYEEVLTRFLEIVPDQDSFVEDMLYSVTETSILMKGYDFMWKFLKAVPITFDEPQLVIKTAAKCNDIEFLRQLISSGYDETFNWNWNISAMMSTALMRDNLKMYVFLGKTAKKKHVAIQCDALDIPFMISYGERTLTRNCIQSLSWLSDDKKELVELASMGLDIAKDSAVFKTVEMIMEMLQNDQVLKQQLICKALPVAMKLKKNEVVKWLAARLSSDHRRITVTKPLLKQVLSRCNMHALFQILWICINDAKTRANLWDSIKKSIERHDLDNMRQALLKTPWSKVSPALISIFIQAMLENSWYSDIPLLENPFQRDHYHLGYQTLQLLSEETDGNKKKRVASVLAQQLVIMSNRKI